MTFDLSLYLVTGHYDYGDEEFLSIIESACQNGVTIVQLREKELSTHDFYELAVKVKAVTDKYNVPLIINDRADICLAVDAAGVHIGDNELPVDVNRKILGPDKIIGVSVKTKKRAEEARDGGADYFGVGAFFNTDTKETNVLSKEELIEVIRHTDVPAVGIGGLKEHNLDILKGTGVKGAAIVSEIMRAENVSEKVKALKNKIDTILEDK